MITAAIIEKYWPMAANENVWLEVFGVDATVEV